MHKIGDLAFILCNNSFQRYTLRQDLDTEITGHSLNTIKVLFTKLYRRGHIKKIMTYFECSC